MIEYPEKISALGWAVCDGRNGEILFGKNEDDALHPIGLAKIATAFTVIQISRKIKVDIDSTKFKYFISKELPD
jgi:D-alanyl-D-alanine carboxypeptidase